MNTPRTTSGNSDVLTGMLAIMWMLAILTLIALVMRATGVRACSHRYNTIDEFRVPHVYGGQVRTYRHDLVGMAYREGKVLFVCDESWSDTAETYFRYSDGTEWQSREERAFWTRFYRELREREPGGPRTQ